MDNVDLYRPDKKHVMALASNSLLDGQGTTAPKPPRSAQPFSPIQCSPAARLFEHRRGSPAVPWRGQPMAWTGRWPPACRPPHSTYPWPARSARGSTQATSQRYPGPRWLTPTVDLGLRSAAAGTGRTVGCMQRSHRNGSDLDGPTREPGPRTDRPDRPADERDQTADERDQTADERDQTADERDQTADERDRAADERDRAADERDWIADEREREANVREERLTAWELDLAERTRRLHVNSDHHIDESLHALDLARQAIKRSEAQLERAAAALEASARRTTREQAAVDREAAVSQRALEHTDSEPR
jgi:hypothetical protein